jgi:8-amino-7-oxononanoate synthase
MSDFTQQLEDALQQRLQDQRYRSRSNVQSPQGIQLTIDNTSYVNFCSNDYLGLANHPEVLTAFHQVLLQGCNLWH